MTTDLFRGRADPRDETPLRCPFDGETIIQDHEIEGGINIESRPSTPPLQPPLPPPPPPPPTSPAASAAMPRIDKILWFVVVPLIWLVAGMSIPAVYEDPLFYLLDAFGVMALLSFIFRRRYTGWAAAWRWTVLALPIVGWLARVGNSVNNPA